MRQPFEDKVVSRSENLAPTVLPDLCCEHGAWSKWQRGLFSRWG
jgi:hypothetical protein